MSDFDGWGEAVNSIISKKFTYSRANFWVGEERSDFYESEHRVCS